MGSNILPSLLINVINTLSGNPILSRLKKVGLGFAEASNFFI